MKNIKKDIILIFENVKNRKEEAKECLLELIPCQSKPTEDNTGFFIKKDYSTEEQYKHIMTIKERYNLKIQTFL